MTKYVSRGVWLKTSTYPYVDVKAQASYPSNMSTETLLPLICRVL